MKGLEKSFKVLKNVKSFYKFNRRKYVSNLLIPKEVSFQTNYNNNKVDRYFLFREK